MKRSKRLRTDALKVGETYACSYALFFRALGAETCTADNIIVVYADEYILIVSTLHLGYNTEIVALTNLGLVSVKLESAVTQYFYVP
jgi:hypothetical protein